MIDSSSFIKCLLCTLHVLNYFKGNKILKRVEVGIFRIPKLPLLWFKLSIITVSSRQSKTQLFIQFLVTILIPLVRKGLSIIHISIDIERQGEKTNLKF